MLVFIHYCRRNYFGFASVLLALLFVSFFEMPMIKTCCGAMCVTKPLTDLLCLVMCTNYKLVVHPTWHSRSVSGIVISVPNLSMRH